MIWDRISRAGQPKNDPIRRDPLSIGVAIAFQAGALSIAPWAAYAIGAVVLGAAAFGASLLSNALFAPKGQERTPSERQATIRQSLGPRLRFYGRVKAGGTQWFFEVKDGKLYSAVTMNEGLISRVLEYWLNDKRVRVDDDGYVENKPYRFRFGRKNKLYKSARILVKNGHSNQTVHGQLDNAFTEITEAHRFRGVANFLSIFDEVPAEKIQKVYPQLNPQVRLVFDASIVKNVRTGNMEWSDNPGDVGYDYLTGVDGAGFPYGAGYLESQIDLPSFQRFATLSDDRIPLKEGGTIPRYRVWGGYAMDEEMRSTLPRILAACDADIYMTTKGTIAIRGGVWEPPVLTLDATKGHIKNAQLRHGQGSLAAFNELTIKYTDPKLDYQETEAERWLDVSNIALRGKVLPAEHSLLMVPHHAQARRLGKIHTHRSNPEWIGTIVTNFYGFNAIGENMVRIVFPLLRIDEDFVVQSVRILDDLTGVELKVSSLSERAYEWDAELEEGTAPGEPPDTSEPAELEPPADIHVSTVQRGSEVFMVATWTMPARTALSQEAEYRVNPEGPWIDMDVSDGDGLAITGVVVSGDDYDFRFRTLSPSNQAGEWSDPVLTVTATPDTSAPAPVTAVVALVDDDEVNISFIMSASNNAVGARIYRNTVNNQLTSTLVDTVYGSPSTAAVFSDVELSVGTYYYWIAAINGSAPTESTVVATGPQVVN